MIFLLPESPGGEGGRERNWTWKLSQVLDTSSGGPPLPGSEISNLEQNPH